MNGVSAAEGEAEGTGAFEVAKDPDARRPVLWAVAVEEGREATNGKGDVGVGRYCDVVEAAHQGTVRCAFHPIADF